MACATCLVKLYLASCVITPSSWLLVPKGQNLTASWHSVGFRSSLSFPCVNAIIWKGATLQQADVFLLPYNVFFVMLQDLNQEEQEKTQYWGGQIPAVHSCFLKRHCAFYWKQRMQLLLISITTRTSAVLFLHVVSKSVCGGA